MTEYEENGLMAFASLSADSHVPVFLHVLDGRARRWLLESMESYSIKALAVFDNRKLQLTFDEKRSR